MIKILILKYGLQKYNIDVILNLIIINSAGASGGQMGHM